MNGPTTPFAQYLHAEKYRAQGESFDEAMNRIAAALTDGTREKFLELRSILRDMRFMPAGRVQSAVGSIRKVTPYNCFVSGSIEDSFVDGSGSIMARATEAATTMRMGGGIGYDFSQLRPRGATIKKLGSKSSGPVSFMEIFDAICKCIASSGHRRGAQMGVLRVDHPDIEEFVHVKQAQGVLEGFNLSIGITDEFMLAVKLGNPFDLKWAGEVYSTIDARALWEKIMRSTWDWAEPGVLFIDRINAENNLGYCERIAATNPCFTGDTKVWTAEHGHIEFSELAGKTVDVLTETRDGKLVYREMSNIRVTQKDSQLVKVTLDTGAEIRCTPSHKFYTKGGSAIEAQRLQPGHHLQSVYRYRANQKGYMRLTNGDHQPLEHHVPFEIAGMGSAWHAHHKNHIKHDNRPSNLDLMDASDHMRHHMVGDRNPARTHPHRNPMKLDPDCTRGSRNGRWRDDLSTEEMLTLREEGMSYAAIAEKVGCSKYTAQKRIREANHKVVSVEWLSTKEDVYCGTVDDPGHRFFVATGENDGVLVANCGEQPLPPNGACLLGSFNLTKYIEERFPENRYEEANMRDGVWEKQYEFNWDQFNADIEPVVRAMDAVIDVATYPLYEQEKEAHNKRRMGLGITGLANAGEALGYPYGSEEFLAFEAKVLMYLRDNAYYASSKIASEKGSFPLFDAEKFLAGEFAKRLPPGVRTAIELDGLRNSHLISIAPTGTISLCADNVSSGIEPVFSKSVERTVQTFDGPQLHTIEDYGYARWGVEPKECMQVTAAEHLAVLTTAQEYVDSSVSKTCNVSPLMGWADFKQLYMDAWEGGAKGCTTFNPEGKRMGILKAKTEEGGSCEIDPETGRSDCQ